MASIAMASVTSVPVTVMVPVAIFGATNGLPSAASPNAMTTDPGAGPDPAKLDSEPTRTRPVIPWEEILLCGWSSTWLFSIARPHQNVWLRLRCYAYAMTISDYVVIGLLIGMMLLAAARSLAGGKFEL